MRPGLPHCRGRLRWATTSLCPVLFVLAFVRDAVQHLGAIETTLPMLAKGDTDGMMAIYADNAKYYWNFGDSLVGKKAIVDYWLNRRTNVIETISFKNDIWMPIKVNEPQQQMEKKGIWLLSWYQVTAKYKRGKSMTQWMHMLYHFDENDKVDEVDQYLDRVPVNAAMPK